MIDEFPEQLKFESNKYRDEFVSEILEICDNKLSSHEFKEIYKRFDDLK